MKNKSLAYDNKRNSQKCTENVCIKQQYKNEQSRRWDKKSRGKKVTFNNKK